MKGKPLFVRAEWDEEAMVWVATSITKLGTGSYFLCKIGTETKKPTSYSTLQEKLFFQGSFQLRQASSSVEEQNTQN